jgi:hypothetical protein
MKRCKNCKEPFTPIRSTLEKFCTKPECIRVWVDTEKAKQWKKTKQIKKAELMTVQDWIKITQQTFNTFIRERDKKKTCISCKQPLVGKFDAGHFYNANNHWSVRFNELNVHGQCVLCNQHKHGNLLNYRENLIKLIGYEDFEMLTQKSTLTRKFTIEELKEITAIYKRKAKELKK